MDFSNSSRDEAIEFLLEEYGQKIKRLVYTFVKDSHTAQDLTQEIFIKCYKNLDQFNNQSSYSTWIHRIAVNHCKDYLRSSWIKRVKSGLVLPLTSKGPSPEEIIVKESLKEELLSFVLKLPFKYRVIISLYYFQELEVREIADVLKLPESTVYTRLRRGKDSLRKSYEVGEVNQNGGFKEIKEHN